jgi:N-methylhydantoinase A/oxoprolinase/acetone carboxylase beta subunit
MASDRCTDINELHASLPRVPARIVTAVFEAYLPVTRSTVEAVQATRERLLDALAA